MRRTEFKFQIWSVSLGVTVCIALPAGPNSLHRSRVFLLSGVPCSFLPRARHISVHLPRSSHLFVRLSSSLPSLCFLSIRGRKERPRDPRFFILFKWQMAWSGIDTRPGKNRRVSDSWLFLGSSSDESQTATFRNLLLEKDLEEGLRSIGEIGYG